MGEANEEKVIQTDEFDWPKMLDTTERDQEILAELTRIADEDPHDPRKEQARINAERLCTLIPRAKALKWYILLYRGYFIFLSWNSEVFMRAIAGYLPPAGTSAIKNIETLLTQAEADGFPKEVRESVLNSYYRELSAALLEWRREQK